MSVYSSPASLSAFAHIRHWFYNPLYYRCYYQPPFIDEKMRQRELKSNLCKLTQLVKVWAGIRTQAYVLWAKMPNGHT